MPYPCEIARRVDQASNTAALCPVTASAYHSLRPFVDASYCWLHAEVQQTPSTQLPLPHWLARILPSVDFERPLPKVDIGDVVVIPDDISALMAPSSDVRMVVKSAAKFKDLAPNAITVADPLAFSGCGRDEESLQDQGAVSTNGHAVNGRVREAFTGTGGILAIREWNRADDRCLVARVIGREHRAYGTDQCYAAHGCRRRHRQPPTPSVASKHTQKYT